MYPSEYPRWVKKALWQRFIIIRWTKTENVCVGNGSCTQTRSYYVSIHADDASYRSAIGIKGTWGVVRFGLYAEAPIVIPGYDS